MAHGGVGRLEVCDSHGGRKLEGEMVCSDLGCMPRMRWPWRELQHAEEKQVGVSVSTTERRWERRLGLCGGVVRPGEARLSSA